ncbi:ABC transporter permease [Streptomyces sp. AJS327]|uniref:ABC transporter permease n=1 Tax=Streptomyces sp. AJS327 TaxID=2545265 RepID=UPI0015DE2DF1|nr:ABC transporter permease [Streptomyces sp. AJS327]MBA0052502.1 ABC transporter permease [Streptomyces sp. AJS327]QNN81305.1 IonTI [Streptomyces sp.]
MKDYAGTGTLLRLALRIDRVRATAWVLGFSLFTVASVSSNNDLYGDPEEQAKLAETVGTNPAMLALGGRAFDLTSTGGINAYQLVAFMSTILGLMSIMLVVRHTRLEEESGRAELAGSAVLGRKAWLASALLLVTGVNLAIAVLTALGMQSTGLAAGGSWAYALGCAGVGIFFAVVAAITAQLTDHARGATGIASAVLGLAYLLRATGDAASGSDGGLQFLTWLSPIGWAEMMRPYADERWAVALLFVLLIAVMTAAIGALVDRRDMGSGILPAKLGPPEGAPSLRSPLALAWRLQQGSLIGWAAGFAVVGAAFGGVADGMVSIAEDNASIDDLLRDLGGSGGIVDVFLATITSLIAIVVGAYAVQATLRLSSEESAERADPVLTTPVERVRWAGSHLIVAALGSVVMLVTAGFMAGLAHGLNSGDVVGEVPRMIGAALAQVPAVWTLIGLSALLFGLLPRLAVLSWVALIVALVIGQFGDVLKLDQMVKNVSPFTHIPDLPSGDFQVVPLLVLTVLAAALTAGGLAGFKRRDIA